MFFFLRPASSVVVQRDARKHPGIELNSSMAKYPLPVDFRWEDYLRLRFVDDQCLRTAMQGFLKGEISRKARLTRRETPFSKCQSCHNERNLPFNLLVYLKPKRYTQEWHWAQIQKPAKEDLMNLRHIRVPEIWLQPMAFMCLTPQASILTNSGLQLDVGPPPAMKLRRRLISKIAYAHNL